MPTFRALVLREEGGKVVPRIEAVDEALLPPGEVTVRIECSTLNYKDGMILEGLGRLVRKYPHVGGVDFAGTVERDQFIGASDMLAVDEDLRYGRTPAGALDHLVAPRRFLDNVDFGVADAFALQQRTGAGAIGTEHRRVKLDFSHSGGNSKLGSWARISFN